MPFKLGTNKTLDKYSSFILSFVFINFFNICLDPFIIGAIIIPLSLI